MALAAGWVSLIYFTIPLISLESILTGLVCDWSHNAPQLFYLYEPLASKAKIPSSCSKADLKTEYL